MMERVRGKHSLGTAFLLWAVLSSPVLAQGFRTESIRRPVNGAWTTSCRWSTTRRFSF